MQNQIVDEVSDVAEVRKGSLKLRLVNAVLDAAIVGVLISYALIGGYILFHHLY